MEIYERHRQGKIMELKAVQIYFEKGYEIFFPITVPGKADFVAVKRGEALKVQVKKATWSRSGNNSYLQCRLVDKYKRDAPMYVDGDWDELIVLSDDGGVWIAP